MARMTKTAWERLENLKETDSDAYLAILERITKADTAMGMHSQWQLQELYKQRPSNELTPVARLILSVVRKESPRLLAEYPDTWFGCEKLTSNHENQVTAVAPHLGAVFHVPRDLDGGGQLITVIFLRRVVRQEASSQ